MADRHHETERTSGAASRQTPPATHSTPHPDAEKPAPVARTPEKPAAPPVLEPSSELEGAAAILDAEIQRVQSIYQAATLIRGSITQQITQFAQVLGPLEARVKELHSEAENLATKIETDTAAHEVNMARMREEFELQRNERQLELNALRDRLIEAQKTMAMLAGAGV